MARYGDGLIGAVGSAACNGLTSTKSAPSAVPLHAARSARSPCPHERRERTEYSCTAKPQDLWRGNGATAPAVGALAAAGHRSSSSASRTAASVSSATSTTRPRQFWYETATP